MLTVIIIYYRGILVKYKDQKVQLIVNVLYSQKQTSQTYTKCLAIHFYPTGWITIYILLQENYIHLSLCL